MMCFFVRMLEGEARLCICFYCQVLLHPEKDKESSFGFRLRDSPPCKGCKYMSDLFRLHRKLLAPKNALYYFPK